MQPTPIASKKILYPNRQAESSKPNTINSEQKPVQTTTFTRSDIKPRDIKPLITKYGNDSTSSNSNLKSVEPIKVSNLEKEVIEAAKKAKNEVTNTSVESTSFTSNTRMLREKICSTVKQNRLPHYGRVDRTTNNSTNGATPAFKFGVTKKGVDTDSPKENLDSSVIINNNVPPYVQKNLKKLISYYPDGIWCAELPLIYR